MGMGLENAYCKFVCILGYVIYKQDSLRFGEGELESCIVNIIPQTQRTLCAWRYNKTLGVLDSLLGIEWLGGADAAC